MHEIARLVGDGLWRVVSLSAFSVRTCKNLYRRLQFVLPLFALMLIQHDSRRSFAQAPAKLHTIVVVDTVSSDIASDMRKNADQVIAQVHRQINRQRSTITTIDGEQFRRTKVLQSIREIQLAKNDAIFFFYSGHGMYDRVKGTYFEPPADDREKFFFQEIRTEIQNRAPRFAALVVDCCSIYPRENRRNSYGSPSVGDGADPFSESEMQVSPLFQKLFFEAKGEIYLRSSSPGQYAVCGYRKGTQIEGGSLFTGIFTDLLSTFSRNATSWNEVIELTRRHVSRQYQERWPSGRIVLGSGDSVSQKSQTPWALKDNQTLFPPAN